MLRAFVSKTVAARLIPLLLIKWHMVQCYKLYMRGHICLCTSNLHIQNLNANGFQISWIVCIYQKNKLFTHSMEVLSYLLYANLKYKPKVVITPYFTLQSVKTVLKRSFK